MDCDDEIRIKHLSVFQGNEHISVLRNHFPSHLDDFTLSFRRAGFDHPLWDEHHAVAALGLRSQLVKGEHDCSFGVRDFRIVVILAGAKFPPVERKHKASKHISLSTN